MQIASNFTFFYTSGNSSTIAQYAWVKAKTLLSSQFFNEPPSRSVSKSWRREASAPLQFPDLFAQRLRQEKQLVRRREKKEKEKIA